MNENLNNKATDDGRMDDLMRKTLEGYRVDPAPGLWKGISRKLFWRDLAHFNFTNLSAKSRVAGIAGILLIAALVYFGRPALAPVMPTAKPANDVTITTLSHGGAKTSASTAQLTHSTQPGSGSINSPSGKAAISPAENVNKSLKNSIPGQIKPLDPKTKPVAYAKNLHIHSDDLLATNTKAITQETPAMPSANINASVPAALDVISPLSPFEATSLWIRPAADTIITIQTSAGPLRIMKSKPAATQFFSASVGVTPEMAFYSQPETYSKLNVWANGGVAWHISRFSVATGPGLGYVYDLGKYRVDYKSRDSVGYYSTVVSFTTGTNNEIIYNTVNQKVYDSLQHSADYRSMNRYAFLQVPLLIGYRLFESNTVSLTFQAGPAVSLLLGSRRSDPVIDYPNGRLIRINDDTPARVHTNWQVWTDLYLEIRMNRKISLYVDPSFKYFLNPMVEQENVSFKAPWTVGLGVGIQFNFGQKKD